MAISREEPSNSYSSRPNPRPPPDAFYSAKTVRGAATSAPPSSGDVIFGRNAQHLNLLLLYPYSLHGSCVNTHQLGYRISFWDELSIYCSSCKKSCGGGLVQALNAQTYGNGTQTIVLSHGFGSDQSAWHYLVPVLACYFKVLVFDLVISPNVSPGLYDPIRYSNFSAYAHDLTCILDEFHVKKSIFVGHSMSAMIGSIAAAKRPDLFKHLVLISGSPRYLNTTSYNGGFSRAQLDSIFNSMKSNYLRWVEGFAPLAIGVQDEDAVAEFENSLRRMNPKTALSAARAVFLSDYRYALRRVRVNCTIIQSETDIVVPESVSYYMKARIRAPATVTILETKGHLPHLTVPSLLLSAVKKGIGINY